MGTRDQLSNVFDMRDNPMLTPQEAIGALPSDDRYGESLRCIASLLVALTGDFEDSLSLTTTCLLMAALNNNTIQARTSSHAGLRQWACSDKGRPYPGHLVCACD